MTTLNEQQARYFTEPNIGSFATIRSDGSPHVTPVWVDWDGEHVLVNTAVGRAKEKHLRRDPRASIQIFDPQNPYEYIEVSGTVELTQDGALDHANTLAKKYFGQDEYPLPAGEQRLLVKIRPERVQGSGAS